MEHPVDPSPDTPLPEQVQIDFTLEVGSGRIGASAIVPTAEVNLTQLLPILQDLSSSIVGAVVDRVNEEGYAVSCKAGCGACCRQFVPLSLFEAEALAEWIRSLPEDQQAVYRDRFHQVMLALRDSGFLDRMDPAKMPHGGGTEHTEFALDYMRLGIPCPFLQDESCTIHPIRPMICREYLVTSPAEFCFSPNPEKVNMIPMPLTLSSGLFRIARTLPNESVGWIPLVFLMAWMKMGAKPGASFHAPGPELLAGFLEECLSSNRAKPAAADTEANATQT